MIRRVPEAFEGTADLSPEGVMHAIREQSLPRHHYALGILLGFPRRAVLAMESSPRWRVNEVRRSMNRCLNLDAARLNAWVSAWSEPGRPDVPALFEGMLRDYGNSAGITTEELPRLWEELHLQRTQHTVNIYGVIWNDFGSSRESRRYQERLKAAFELSGILDVERLYGRGGA